MNIKQALKRKNKLVGLMTEEWNKVSQYNVTDDGNPRPYSAVEAMAKWMNLSEELVTLKAKIHLANGPMYDQIFRLAETKNQVKYLKSLNCQSGKVQNRWDSEAPTIKHAEINVVERDKMVKDMEVRIEMIQDDLDQWNHNTIIED
jgi:hypothetical protein